MIIRIKHMVKFPLLARTLLIAGCLLTLLGFMGHYLTDALCVTANNSETVLCQNVGTASDQTAPTQAIQTLHTGFNLPPFISPAMSAPMVYGLVLLIFHWTEFKVPPTHLPPK